MRSRAITLLAMSALIVTTAASAAPLPVYDDALQSGCVDWSWATVNLAQFAVVHAGTHAAGVSAAAWQAFFVHRAAGIDAAVYGELDLWLRGSGAAGQTVSVALISGGTAVGSPVTVTLTGAWVQQQLSFATLGVAAADSVDGLWVQDQTGGQSSFFVDDVQLVERTSPPPPPPPPTTVTVTVDPSAARRAISQGIYGVNFGDDAQAAQLHWPVRRWGGNSTSRYNWQTDVHSVGTDWFFFNYTNIDPAPAHLPDGSSADLFIDSTRAAGGEPIVTLPLIGWTPIDRTRRWSFPVSVYGPQQKTECTETGNASWCNPDAGNGLHTDGTPITAEPRRTSQTIAPSFVTDWLAHIASRVGTASTGGVRLFDLDNEPALWNSSHRDVHPNPTTYSELWSKTVSIASAVKAQDPAAKLLGPVSWGWCEYFYSAADGCADGADRMSHGDTPWIDWYLDQAKAYELAHPGVRLVDYLDLHYYPQNDGVALSDDESAATAAVRLRSLKSLYDPNYVDESWVGQGVNKVRMIPRMRDWVANHYPGTKLAITEYSWGNDDGPSSALAQAEALAIFGREGLDLATRWVAPAPGTRVEDAFRLYLDFNGTGGTVSGDSIQAVSSDVDAVGAYAVERADGRRYFLLFNKDTQAKHASVHLQGGAPIIGNASLVRFDPAHRIAPVGVVAPVAGALELDLPARSATLAVVESQAPPASTSFYTVTPCRVLDTRSPQGTYGGPQLAAAAARGFALAGRCGIPADARAASANVTIIATASGTLRSYATNGVVPNTSVIDFSSGSTRANNAILKLSSDGQAAFALRAEGSAVHVVVDVNGYFR